MQRCSLRWALTACIALTFFSVFMEWLFFFTIPSFMSRLGLAKALLVWLNASLAICFVVIPIGAFFWYLGELAGKRGMGKVAAYLPALPAALLAVSITLIMVDNFTYTMFDKGIVDTTRGEAYIYLFVFLILFGCYTQEMVNGSRKDSSLFNLPLTRWTVGLLMAAAVIGPAISMWDSRDRLAWLSPYTPKDGRDLPNIIFFASDGVEANHTSAYGYDRTTTPNLDRLIPNSWFAENVFSNSARSVGATTSLLTGKLPTTNGIWLSGHTLQGPAAFEHLPLILRKIGYTTAQLGAPRWVDAQKVNMQFGFDFIGPARHTDRADNLVPIWTWAAFSDDTYFIHLILERVTDRWFHLLGIRLMVNHYKLITGKAAIPVMLSDAERMRLAKEYVQTLPQPFFLHVHLMGTHCCPYENAESYDDAVYQSDKYFGELIQTLERRGLLDKTLIVYSSDHGRGWSPLVRVPLIMQFPKRERTGLLAGNTELIDVMPTLLDYLEQPIPSWVEGHSLMSNRPRSAQAPIFAITDHRTEGVDSTPVSGVKPDVSGLALIVCDQWFNWVGDDRIIQRGRVERYRGDCASNPSMSYEDALAVLRQHLHARNLLTEAETH